MENVKRPLARFLEFYRAGYEAYVRFLCTFYGVEPVTKAADLAYQDSRDAQEKAP